LNQLPNRWISFLYHEAYIRQVKAAKNPNGPEAKELQGQAMANLLAGHMM
jgi:hypothetical protein